MGYEFTSPISSFPVGQFVINSLECHVSGTGPGTGTSSTAHGAVPSHWSSIPLPHSREGWDQHLMLSPLKSPRIPPYPHMVELELILGALACLSRMCCLCRGGRWCPRLPDKPSFLLEAWQDAWPCLGAGMEGQRPGLSRAAVPLGRRSLSCN